MAMLPRTHSRGFVLVAVAFLLVMLGQLRLKSADLRLDYQPAAYAIKGARIVTDPATTIDSGTLVIRKGVIEAVGPLDQVKIPYDAEVIDGKGLTLYPGFLDLYTTLGVPAGVIRSKTGPGRPVNYSDFALASTPPDNRNGLTPEFEVAEVYELSDSTAEERRGLGFLDIIAAPGGSIAGGQSALVSLGSLPRRESILRAPLALHLNVKPPSEPTPPVPSDDAPGPRRRRGGAGGSRYPTSLMGTVSHLRQAMLDAEYERALRAYHEAKGGERPASDPTLEAFAAARSKALPVWWEANSEDEIHRALDLAEEFGTTCVIVGGREAAKVTERLKKSDIAVVLKLDYPEEPKVPTEAEYLKKEPIEREEPLAVSKEKLAKWKESVATAAALNKAGIRFGFATDGISKINTFPSILRKVISEGLPKDAALDALTRRAAEIAGIDKRLGTLAPGKLGHVVAWTGGFSDEKAKARYVFVDGQKFDLEKSPAAAAKKKGRRDESEAEAKKGDSGPKKDKDKEVTEPKPKDAAEKPDDKTPKKAEPTKPKAPFVDIETEFASARKPTLKTGGNALIKNVAILTVDRKRPSIPNGAILIKDGKIAAIGETLDAPEGVKVIDGAGLVAMPGIIDTHSHMAIQGGVNEMSLSLVPEVRVHDVVTGDDPALYRSLAGGNTTARLLHGSANTVGGQDAVIKIKPGLPGRDLLIKGNPQGVKFALGENVTRVTGRFPNTRMGVEAAIERAFLEARAYADRRDAQAKAKDAPPFRRDLRLEALAGVLDGSIQIHSHCYRADEILMLLNVAERHGVKVRSLQHVLEGYKVASEIAAHGASASTFSDWWAYKIEAQDAIPHNAALMTEAGVSVCIKSDSEELARHLNLEAAKMMKYGGASEFDALAMITLNPAKELGIEGRVGTLEVGKDADIALFNGHPFNAYSRCEMALIDGEVWFQRSSVKGETAPKVEVARTLPVVPEAIRDREFSLKADPNATYALLGATVHPVSGPVIKDGVVIVSGGKIQAVGGPETVIPASSVSMDLKGYDIWPGLIDPGSSLGLFEIGSLRETQDSADSARFQPELRTSAALHPDSELIAVTRANGVLNAFAEPTGGVISGQGCVIGLDGWVPKEMVVLDKAALHVNIPGYVPPTPPDAPRPAFGPPEAGDPRQRRKEQIEEIKEEFHRAKAYDVIRKEAHSRNELGPIPDPRLDALAPYALGLKPVIFQAEHRVEILDALKIAKDLKLKAIITGGRDAWQVADLLKADDIPVILGGSLLLPPEESSPYDAQYANAAKLHKAGVRFAIRSKSGGPDSATGPRNLPYEAATAAAFGLPPEEALKAVTLYPARLLGVDKELGSIEPGKRANLVITTGDILQPATEVKLSFLNGKPMAPESLHTKLYGRYKERLNQVRAKSAPLGLDRKEPAQPTASLNPEPEAKAKETALAR